MAGQSIGTIFAELDLDASRYVKSQQKLLKDATSTTLNIEENFKKLGIKSSAEYDLMRQKIMNANAMILNSSKATANDIVRAEQAKHDQLKRLDEQQFGRQTSLLESMKKNWIAAAAAIGSAMVIARKAWDLVEAGASFREQEGVLNNLSRKYGTTADVIVSAMQRASDGLISRSDLMQISLAGIAKGLKPEQLINLADAARILGDAVGKDATTALKDLTEALETGRTKGLKNYLGTAIDLEATFGTLTSKMSEAEKAQAMYNITMIAATGLQRQQTGEVSSAADKIDRLKASWENLKTTVGVGLSDFVYSAGKFLNQTPAELLGFKAPGPATPPQRDSWYAQPAANPYQAQIEALKKQLQTRSDSDASGKKNLTDLAAAEKEASEEIMKFNAAKIAVSDFEKYQIGSTQRLKDMETAARQHEMDELTKSAEYKQAVLQTEHTTAVSLISETTEAEFEAIEKSKKLASEKASAYRTMFSGMKGDAKNYYDDQLKALDEQRDNYEKLVGKNAVTDAWYARQKKKLDQELTRSSNDFFGGIRVGYERSLESATTFAQMGESLFQAFTTSTSNMLSDNFFNLFTGRMDDLKLDWQSMWDSMARTAADKLADIAAQKALDAAISGADWLGTAMGWWAAGSWDIKKDQIAMLHKGEMVVPADEAERVRREGSGADLGERWGGDYAAYSPGSFGERISGAMMDSITGTARGFAANKLAGLVTTGQFAMSLNPLGMMANFVKVMVTGAMEEYEARERFATIYGPGTPFDETMSGLYGAMPYGAISREDMERNFRMAGMRTYNPYDYAGGAGGEGGGYGSSLGADRGDPEGGGAGLGGGVARHGGWMTGPMSGYKPTLHGRELVLNEDQVKAVRELNAGKGKGGQPVTFNLYATVADKKTMDEFAEKIYPKLEKLKQWGH